MQFISKMILNIFEIQFLKTPEVLMLFMIVYHNQHISQWEIHPLLWKKKQKTVIQNFSLNILVGKHIGILKRSKIWWTE